MSVKSLFIQLSIVTIFLVAPNAQAQRPEPGEWWAVSPGASVDEPLRVETKGDSLVLVSTEGTASDWGPIAVAADGTIEFHRGGDPQQLCTLKRTQYDTYVGTCRGSATRPLTLARRGNPGGFEIPAGDDDLRILARARQILSGPSVWDRRREPACDEDRAKQSWSLFCALSQASLDVTGVSRGLRPVWQEARAAVVEVAGRSFQGALKDFNSLESTTYSDVVRAFDVTERRLRTMMACVALETPPANLFAGSPSAGGEDARPAYYWVERMGHTVNGQTFVFSNALGPMDRQAPIPDDMLAYSAPMKQRNFGDDPRHPVDVTWALPNGHRSRFASLCGEVLGYRDSVAEAADYFDHLIDGVYFRQPKTAKQDRRSSEVQQRKSLVRRLIEEDDDLWRDQIGLRHHSTR